MTEASRALRAAVEGGVRAVAATSAGQLIGVSGHRALLRAAARGAASSVAGTAAMTTLQLTWRAVRHRAPLAPQVIADAALYATGADNPPSTARYGTAGAAHLIFGASAGTAYGILRHCLGGHISGAAAEAATGAAFGAAVWGASYTTWIPAAGLVPSPAKDDTDRQARLLVGHLVYGMTTALAFREA